MKHTFFLFIILLSIGVTQAFSFNEFKDKNRIIHDKDRKMAGIKIKIRVNSKTFTATLLRNASTSAFLAHLPLTLSMNELNGDEKYGDLPEQLPTNSSNPKTIQAGDLMLFGAKTLVIFYKTFPTSYSYTRLGRIDDVAGLSTALGSKGVTLTIEME